MTKKETFYKVLDKDGSARIGVGKWHLPTKEEDGSWTPGEWMPPIEGEIVPCQKGYHLCREQDLIHWLGPAIFEVEYKGEVVESDNKIVVREARLVRRLENWNDRTARLFAADCAEHVLHLYEDHFPNDKGPRESIAEARRIAMATPVD